MGESSRRQWVAAVVLIGVVYGLVGILFAAPATHARAWRLAAWAVSGAVYATHIGYERLRLGASPRATALHTAMAAAVGAFLLAVAATVHAMMVPSHAPYWLFLLALVVWPIITALPAFLVALAVAAALARLSAKRSAG